MKRILTIVGARPQFIKAAAISHTIRDKYAGLIAEDILHTGQHYDEAMSGHFFTELDIPMPKYNLGVGSGSHAKQTALMLNGIEEILKQNSYDGVLVYGDTNSTLAGALAAAKLQVPVYHVEAGLRSFNRAMPEEINRVVTDHVSTLLFAPTQTAMHNLHNEGFGEENAIFSGDVMLDNVRYYAPIAAQRRLPVVPDTPFILATVHRDFNTDRPERLAAILSALEDVGRLMDQPVLFPVHPRTRQRIGSLENALESGHLLMVEPLSYLDTLAAMQRATLVMTDSGGLQKEAYFCGRGCVILRPETEWVEIVECGAAILADADKESILTAARTLAGAAMSAPTQFGQGNASELIVEKILA